VSLPVDDCRRQWLELGVGRFTRPDGGGLFGFSLPFRRVGRRLSGFRGLRVTTRSFHPDNRNIDRRNDANTAEFTRTDRGGAVTLDVMRLLPGWTWRYVNHFLPGWTWRDLVIGARSRPARFAGWTVAAILALAAATAYGVALWNVPEWMHATTPQDRYNARVLVVSVGGAIVVGAGLLYTARNYRLSRRGQVTDRFTKALERLGSTELYVRVGGVHALEHVMRDSRDHHDDVIEVLNEFIRGAAPRVVRQSDREAWMHPVTGSVPDLPGKPTPDVQAALTGLASRPLRPWRGFIKLDDLHLRGAGLHGADLTGVFLFGTDLTGADLTSAHLRGANLTSARLAGAFLGDANLTNADLRLAVLDGAFLGGANLTSARLDGADLRGAVLDDADLRGANLTSANLTGAFLARADLRRTYLEGANLRDAELTIARLDGARLDGARLDGADLRGVKLGPDPRWVPLGWIVTDPKTGELRRPAGFLSAAWLTGAVGPVSPQRGIVPHTKFPTGRFHLNAAASLAA
jgi:uncharacterized protein YjbI with pentapeptide repeats